MTFFLYLLVTFYGLALGSLYNVVIYRLPIMMRTEWAVHCCEFFEQSQPETPSINLFYPRSFCPNCNTMIKVWQNIPVISYLVLKGRCYTCRHPIPIRYPLIELLTSIMFLLASLHFGITLTLVFALIFISAMICLFFIDLDTQLLPDSLTLGILWVGLIANTQELFTSLPDAVWGAVGAYLSLWIFIKLFYLITGKIGMGNGDFKLFAAFGAWFGVTLLPLILLFACISGSVIGLIYLKVLKKPIETAIPFGPFLCVSGLIALFWGKAILTWYLGW